MYLTQPEHAKNILQNEVLSDFVFIVKMRKNLWKMTVIGRIRTCENILLTRCRASPTRYHQPNDYSCHLSEKVSTSLQSSALSGFRKLKRRLTTQPVSRLGSEMILHSLTCTATWPCQVITLTGGRDNKILDFSNLRERHQLPTRLSQASKLHISLTGG